LNALIILSALGLLTLLAEMAKLRRLIVPLAVIGLAAAIGASVMSWNNLYLNELFKNMIRFDNYAIAFTCLLAFTGILWFLLSGEKISGEPTVADHTALIIFALAGGVMLTCFNNMTMLFLGVEILSIPVYVLAGSKKDDLSSNESAFKYFLMGAFASGFLLFGIALIYGATGSFDLQTINNAIGSAAFLPAYFYAGVLMIVAGLAFKVSLVPFHFWGPDVYSGAPTNITAFMATVVKASAFAAFFRLFAYSFTPAGETWMNVLMVLAALTLTVGNITAVFQQGVKRMLAYSSVAHAGFMVIAIVAMNQESVGAIFYYLAAYTLASIAAFGVLINVVSAYGNDSFDSFNGLAKRNPFLAFAMTIALLSMAGIPPLSGFFAKYFILNALLVASFKWHVVLAIIAILTSLVGVYYYFRIIIAMYWKAPSSSDKLAISPLHQVLLLITALGIIALGLYPDLLMGLKLI
jgi:NADH-quinone oxidoreductase subunit N